MTAHFARIEPTIEARLLASLGEVAGDAGGSLDRHVQPGLYDRLDWLDPTHRQLWPDAPLAIAAVRRGEDALWLPIRDDGQRHGRALASWYTLAFAPLFTPGTDAATRTLLLDRAARLLRDRFATINLWPLEPTDAAALHRAFAANGWLVRDSFEAAHWVAHTAGLDFDAYWANRSSRLRNTVRRRARKSAVACRVFTAFDAQAWADYEAIYAQSWKPAEGSMAFLHELARAEGAAGTLRLGLATRDGRAVAAQLWTVENGVATIHKLAHLESEREHSPGTRLSEAMFRHVLDDDRPDLISYGNGDEAYKADWMDERRERRRLQLFNLRSLTGLQRAAAKALAKAPLFR
ncbi:GNAT family N-acetyltransferase [Sphingomonas turrisvirgatae]|uniref:BioF2-like acetyltransferase domain-containing protein n=1 Tax=Sphingomonas turrisvirgatae TaxID=1888892 RepID=A0A1E3LVQ7_9SPHN|nr:GNAT family N-acetyltransferase [Sphingomonas turrisvirgatae]ODP37838.1 hypothetical protein BFL28_02440 [Sphingomonas turrisvirgatae]